MSRIPTKKEWAAISHRRDDKSLAGDLKKKAYVHISNFLMYILVSKFFVFYGKIFQNSKSVK
ncbi:MAG: hypothetical protein HF970_10470 [ANME-2 cluster archaeon]|nr:hypothetical protein [ANME-2 cluster archaeon]